MISVVTSTQLWFNALAIVLLVLNQAEVIAIFPPAWMPYVAAFIPAANAIMRFRVKDEVIVATPKTVRRHLMQRSVRLPPRAHDDDGWPGGRA